MEAVLGTLVSGLFGGGVGLIGTVIGKVFGWLELKEKNKALAISNEHELKLLSMELADRNAEREHEAEVASVAADTTVRSASYSHDSTLRNVYRWVDSARAMVRPTLTVLAFSLLAYTIYLGAVHFGDFGAYKQALDQANFLAVTAYVWWFGSRDKGAK